MTKTSPFPDATIQALRSLARSFRHRDYRLFFTGQFVSLVGTWMQQVAQSWLVYRLTGSSLALGVVAFAGQIPVFLLSPFGGVIADRANRRSILLGTQAVSMLQALTLAVLTLAGHIQVWEVMALATLLGLANAVDIPTRQSFIVELVGKEDLHNAIALNSSMFNTARILGPSVAGIFLATIGEGWCFMLNALSFVAVLICLARMGMPRRPRAATRTPVLRHLQEGFQYAWTAQEVRAILLLLGATSCIGLSFIVLMPVFAEDVLHSGPKGLGFLMAATGCGSLLGALLLAARREGRGLGRYIIAGVFCLGLGLILFSLSRSLRLSEVLLVPVGFCMIVSMASSNTLLQLLCPDSLRGRVMALFSMMYVGMAPFGSLLAGFLAGCIGAQGAVAVSGVACLAAAVLWGRTIKGL